MSARGSARDLGWGNCVGCGEVRQLREMDAESMCGSCARGRAPKTFDADVSLGTILCHLREEKGWTQRQLAERVGVHYNVISRIERSWRRPRRTTLQWILEALGVSEEELRRWSYFVDSEGIVP